MALFALPAQPNDKEFAAISWVRWFSQLREGIVSNAPLQVPAYTLTTLPNAAQYTGRYIDVTNATGGPKLCRSDGTNWKIANTLTTVS